MTAQNKRASPRTSHSTTKASVEELRFDQHNPRLLGQDAKTSDEAIIAQLYRSAELDELLQSISTNGYLDIEPLIVMPSQEDSASLIVLEGNRRLAALRLLREKALSHRIEQAEKLRIQVPQVNDARRSSFNEVSVYSVATREEARSFIGFKHINGAAKWDSYAKARFAADWYKRERDKGVTLEDIARAIGDRHDTVKRMVSALYVLEQAENKGKFDLDDRATKKFNFSHLYTALSRSQYMSYLGIDASWVSYDPKPDPVPHDQLDRLKQVLEWIYGSKMEASKPMVRSQNPDIKRLGEVLANTEALHVLETTSDLDKAHESTQLADQRFTTSLVRARDEARNASASLRAYDGKDKALLNIAEDIKETAATIYQRMERKYREAGGEK